METQAYDSKETRETEDHMATGPQKIPGASQAHFYGDGQFSGSNMETNTGVIHTTEGRTLPDYNGGSIAPTVTGIPDFTAKKIRWYQHYNVDESARALANKLGGVETNTLNVFQIELVGTCDDAKKTSWGTATAGVDYLHWPTAPDWALAEVAWLVRWLHDNHNLPLTCVSEWLAYGKDTRRPGVVPASYGASPARMTFAQWQSFTGWCGHQHVPENDHGDPGSMNFARVIALAKGSTTPTPAPTQPAPVAAGASTMITEVEAGGPDLKAGEWTLLKMAADSAIAQGPCRYTVACYVVVSGAPGTRVTGRFHDLLLKTNRPSADLPQDAGVIGKDGTLNCLFTRPGDLVVGEQLKLEVMADAPATITHRLLRGLRWTV